MLEDKIQLKVEEIKEDSPRINELKCNGKILLNPGRKSSYAEAWAWRYYYDNPGISDANVVALFYNIVVDHNASLDRGKMELLIRQYFSQEFGDKNVLLMSTDMNEDGNQTFDILTYPLVGRVLDPRRWSFQSKIPPDKLKKFYDYIQMELGLKERVSDKDRFIQDDDRLLEDMTELTYSTVVSAGSIQTDKPYDDITKRFRQTYEYFRTVESRAFDQARRGFMLPETFLTKVKEYLDNTHKDLTSRDKEYLLEQMYNAVYEYYKLAPLISDRKISDIKVIRFDDIRVKVGGKRYTSNIKFDSREDYRSFVESIAIRHAIDLDSIAMSHFVDKTGNEDFILRNNITTEYVASESTPYLHIRKIPKKKPSINDLIRDGMLTKELAQWLIRQAKEANGMIFVGRGGSGKTTLMNVLLEYIPYIRSVMVCQDNEELFSNNHPDIMFVHTVEAQGGDKENCGYPVYDLKDITKNGLLVDIDYFVIGEIKGAEAMYFLNASFTGAKSWASLHSSVATLDKLADYVMYESKYTREQALNMLKNISYVIHMDEYKVQDIAKVGAWNRDIQDLDYTTIYTAKDGFSIPAA